MSEISNIWAGESVGLAKAAKILRSILPTRWKLRVRVSRSSVSDDGAFEISAPDGSAASLRVEWKKRLFPKDVGWIRANLPDTEEPHSLLVVSPFLSGRVREKLAASRINYMDESGNASILLERPGLLISMRGSDKNPSPAERGRPTLKGPKAGRIVRALTDFVPPIGVRGLARRAGVDAGYASRIVRWLGEEDLITRANRGKITDLKWQGLIRAWTASYSFLESNAVRTFLEPRGMETLKGKLRDTRLEYVLTGSLAANEIAPFAPARSAAIYTQDPDTLAGKTGLRPLEGGGSNVILAAPYDRVVFERTKTRNGLNCASPSQIAADLLTGPGRNPAEAEELMKWMEKNEADWRA